MRKLLNKNILTATITGLTAALIMVPVTGLTGAFWQATDTATPTGEHKIEIAQDFNPGETVNRTVFETGELDKQKCVTKTIPVEQLKTWENRNLQMNIQLKENKPGEYDGYNITYKPINPGEKCDCTSATGFLKTAVDKPITLPENTTNICVKTENNKPIYDKEVGKYTNTGTATGTTQDKTITASDKWQATVIEKQQDNTNINISITGQIKQNCRLN